MKNIINIIVEYIKGINTLSWSLLLNAALAGGVIYFGTSLLRSDTLPSCTSTCDCICTDYSGLPAFQPINTQVLRKMAQDFQNTRNTQNDDRDLDRNKYPIRDASSVWFALDDLKRFIWEIEHRTCDCEMPKELGVRIYYARYSDDLSEHGIIDNIDDYKLKHTVFMVPTFDRLRGTVVDHIDFNLIDPCPPEVNLQAPDFVALIGGKNHGTLCPPICEGTAFGN
jgi:hypothetical protein